MILGNTYSKLFVKIDKNIFIYLDCIMRTKEILQTRNHNIF